MFFYFYPVAINLRYQMLYTFPFLHCTCIYACVLDISIFETLSHVFIFTHRTSTSFRYLIVIDFSSYDCFVYFSVHIHIFSICMCAGWYSLMCFYSSIILVQVYAYFIRLSMDVLIFMYFHRSHTILSA
jgi:hypothetical protein